MIDFKKVLADLELDAIDTPINADLQDAIRLVAMHGIEFKPLIYNPQVINNADYKWAYLDAVTS